MKPSPSSTTPAATALLALATLLAGSATAGLAVPAAGISLAVGTAAFALAPEPDPVAKRWELAAEFSPLRVIYVEIPGVGPRGYMYLTYKVANLTGKEQTLAVSFDLATGDGNVLRAGRGVSVDATKAVMAHAGNPLAQDPIGILGPIQHGRENAREGIVIWAIANYSPEALTVYAAGLSGETATIELPKIAVAAEEPAAEGKPSEAKPTEAKLADAKPAVSPVKKDEATKAILRKTKMLTFTVPGELSGLRDAPLDIASERWIMR